ncbi:YrhB domain-containing protein [Dactylosporangium sp. NPDC005572]|uniref:YrhB domain-containing protein n=1 Tax=Dactylosporangium sp. NPDC005572 TaxID=3156889 RepID=UPI0033BB6044
MDHDDVVDRLLAVIGEPDEAPPPVAVAELEDIFGTPLPADFLELVRRVPDGTYRGCLQVLRPQLGLAVLLRLVFEGRRETVPDDLVPWAHIGDDYIVCWVADGPPGAWRTGVFDRHGGAVLHPFDGGCAEFLLAFLAGTTGLSVLDFVEETSRGRLFDHEPPVPPPARVDPAGWNATAGEPRPERSALDEQEAAAAAAAFLAEEYRQWLRPGEPMPVRTQPERAFRDGRRYVVPYNSIDLLDHGDLDAELGGNAPILVDLDTGECRHIDLNETFAYRDRGHEL